MGTSFVIFLTVGFVSILLNLWLIQGEVKETNRLLKKIAGEGEEEGEGEEGGDGAEG